MNQVIANPSYTTDEFAAAERISRSLVYQMWRENWGPDFYYVGNQRRISHEARERWRKAREEAAKTREARSAVPAH